MSQTQVVRCVLIPRQAYQCLQIGELDRIVGALRIDVVKFGHLLLENLLGCLVPQFVLSLLKQFFLFRTAFTFSQFCSDVLDLLFQEVFLLLLLKFELGLSLDFGLQVEQFLLLVQRFQCHHQAVGKSLFLQHFYPVSCRKRQRSAEKIALHEDIGNLVDGINCLVWNVVVILYESNGLLEESLGQGFEQLSFCLFLRRPDFWQTLHIGHIEGIGFNDAFQFASAQTLYDDSLLVLLVGHVDDFHQFCESSLLVEIFRCGSFCVLMLLAEDTDDCFWILFQHVYQFLTLFSTHQDGG